MSANFDFLVGFHKHGWEMPLFILYGMLYSLLKWLADFKIEKRIRQVCVIDQ